MKLFKYFSMIGIYILIIGCYSDFPARLGQFMIGDKTQSLVPDENYSIGIFGLTSLIIITLLFFEDWKALQFVSRCFSIATFLLIILFSIILDAIHGEGDSAFLFPIITMPIIWVWVIWAIKWSAPLRVVFAVVSYVSVALVVRNSVTMILSFSFPILTWVALSLLCVKRAGWESLRARKIKDGERF